MIKERSQVIPDQSVHLFTDWFRESLFSVTIIFVNATFPSAAVLRGEAELREAVLVVFKFLHSFLHLLQFSKDIYCS